MTKFKSYAVLSLVLVLGMINLNVINAFASSTGEVGDLTKTAPSTDALAIIDVAPSFEITYPKSLTLTESQVSKAEQDGYIAYTFKYKTDLPAGVFVGVDKSVLSTTWSQNGKASITSSLASYEMARFITGQTSSSDTIKLGVPKDLSAGTWTTTVNCNVHTTDMNSLEPGLWYPKDMYSSTLTCLSWADLTDVNSAYHIFDLSDDGTLTCPTGASLDSKTLPNTNNVPFAYIRNGKDSTGATVPKSAYTAFVLPDTVKRVGDGTQMLAIAGGAYMWVFPKSDYTISKNAFKSGSLLCTSILNNVTSIEPHAFEGAHVFNAGSLKDTNNFLNIPFSCKSIGEYGLALGKYSNAVVIQGAPAIDKDAFNTTQTLTLHLPTQLKEQYKVIKYLSKDEYNALTDTDRSAYTAKGWTLLPVDNETDANYMSVNEKMALDDTYYTTGKDNITLDWFTRDWFTD